MISRGGGNTSESRGREGRSGNWEKQRNMFSTLCHRFSLFFPSHHTAWVAFHFNSFPSAGDVNERLRRHAKARKSGGVRKGVSFLFFVTFASCKPLQMGTPSKLFVHLLHIWKERTVMQAIHYSTGIQRPEK